MKNKMKDYKFTVDFNFKAKSAANAKEIAAVLVELMHLDEIADYVDSDIVYDVDKVREVNDMNQKSIPSAMLCDHANEVPAVCKCNSDCYCKTHTCRELI